MSLPIDTNRLLHAIAALLSRQVLPNLVDPTARHQVEGALGVIVRNVLGRGIANPLPVSEHVGISRVDRQGTVQHSDGESRIPQQLDAKSLLAILDNDYAPRARLGEAATALFRELREGADIYPPPTPEELTVHLRQHYPDDLHIRADGVNVLIGGYSKQTVMFDRIAGDGSVESLVMQRDHPKSYAKTTVIKQFAVLKALYEVGFPVPEPLWLDITAGAISGPLMVTKRVLGNPAGGPKGAGPEAGDNPVLLMADVLARLHAIDVRKLNAVGGFDQPWNERSLVDSIEYWESYYRETMEAPVVAVDLAYAWLRANARLGLQPAAIVHGEIGYHNLLASNSRVAALLDWEFAHVGSPVEDLCYVRNQVERLGTFESFIDIYVDRGGTRPSASALEFYDVYRLARNAGLFAAGIRSFNRGDNDDLPMVNFSSMLFAAYVRQLHARMKAIVADDRFYTHS